MRQPRAALFWLLVTTLSATAGGGTTGAVPELAAGAALPPLAGRNLAGESVTVREAARGRAALLVLGFSYASRRAVETWSDRFRDEFAADSQLTCIEVPMMSGIGARIGRPFIERGMRGGTPPGLHRNVIVVWNDVGEWKRRLTARDTDLAYLLLLDPNGLLVWSGTGAVGATDYERLSERIRDLRRH